MNRRRLVLAVLVVALAGAAAVWRFVPPAVPAGQPPLSTLDQQSLEALRADFNRDVEMVRVIVLLSPT